jgi:hypothetical protein
VLNWLWNSEEGAEDVTREERGSTKQIKTEKTRAKKAKKMRVSFLPLGYARQVALNFFF